MVEIKIHKGKIVSLCDSELIGRCFEERDKQLMVSERFYRGEKKSEKEIIEILKEADNVNIVGRKSVEIALKAKVICKDGIKYIKKVPFAMMFSMV